LRQRTPVAGSQGQIFNRLIGDSLTDGAILGVKQRRRSGDSDALLDIPGGQRLEQIRMCRCLNPRKVHLCRTPFSNILSTQASLCIPESVSFIKTRRAVMLVLLMAFRPISVKEGLDHPHSSEIRVSRNRGCHV
jgi:hypothetical protein